jgi:DNA-directed RNA polymerase specialized sigma24 family protein
MSVRSQQQAELAAAVAALIASFHGEGEFAHAELDRLLSAATGFLQATLPELSHDEQVDVVDGVLLELLELDNADKLDPDRNPAGLFLTMVHRRGIDQLRRVRRRDVPLDDDEAAANAEPPQAEEEAVLDALASKEELATIMRDLARQGRPDLTAVIRVWLDLTHQLGAASSALVAERLDLDRSTVNRRVAEIRDLLGDRNRS